MHRIFPGWSCFFNVFINVLVMRSPYGCLSIWPDWTLERFCGLAYMCTAPNKTNHYISKHQHLNFHSTLLAFLLKCPPTSHKTIVLTQKQTQNSISHYRTRKLVYDCGANYLWTIVTDIKTSAAGKQKILKIAWDLEIREKCFGVKSYTKVSVTDET